MKVNYGTVIVKDIGESIDFYKDLGFKIESSIDLPDKSITFLKGEGDAGIELISDNTDKVGLTGIAMEVEDIDKFIEDNESLNLEVSEVPNGKLVFVKDPNGVTLSVSSKK